MTLVRGYTRHLASFSPGSGRTSPLDRGLVLEWRFDPFTGLVVPDWSGYSRDILSGDAALTNGTWITTSFGPGLQFAVDGSGQTNVTIQQMGIADSWTAITLEVFFRLDAYNGTFQLSPTLGFEQTNLAGAGFPAGYLFRGDGVNGRTWQLVTGTTRRNFNGTVSRPSVGDYVHAVMTYDGADLRGYREGVADGSVAATGVIDDSQFGGDDEIHVNLRVGGDAHGITVLVARIYNRALTAVEVARRYGICLKRNGESSSVWLLPRGFVSGGITYNQAAAGVWSGAGNLIKQTQISPDGIWSGAGSLVRQTQVSPDGVWSGAGAIIKQAQKLPAGVLTSSGSLVKETQKSPAGVFTSSGSLIKQAQKELAGIFTSSGSLVRMTGKELAGILTSSGALATLATHFIDPAGIASAEAFGAAIVMLMDQYIIPNGITTEEAFGLTRILGGERLMGLWEHILLRLRRE